MNLAVASQNPLFHRPWLRRAAWGLVSLLLLWLLGWLALPPLIKTQLESRLGEQLGRKVTVGRVDFKPWTLELTLTDVAVAHQADASAQLAFQRVYIDAELQSLLRLAPVVDALQLDGLRVNLIHSGDGHYDVDDVLTRLSAAPSQQGASPTLHYAFYNLVVSDAEVVLTDSARNQQHRLSGLNLSLPFLSNLDSKRDVLVQPKLAFELNGSRFESTARTTPFSQNRKTDAQLLVRGLDLRPYLTYLPAHWPVQLHSAVIDADLALSFEQVAQPAVKLSGQVNLSAVRLTQTHGAPTAGPDLLTFERLGVTLDDVQPLARTVLLRRLEWIQPHLLLHRNKRGALNLQALMSAPPTTQKTIKSRAAQKDPTGASAQKSQDTAGASATAWQVRVADVSVVGAELHWLDEATTRPVRLGATALTLNAHALAWPLTQPVPFDGTTLLAGAPVRFEGQATDQQARVVVQVNGLPLALAAPYLADVLVPRLDGNLSTDLTLHWAAAHPGQPQQTQLQVTRLTLEKLALRDAAKTPLASLERLQLEDSVLDVAQQTLKLGRVQVSQPRAALSRLADGRWMAQDWLKTAAPDLAQRRVTSSTTPPRPWSISLVDARLTGGALSYHDAAVTPAVALDLTGVALQVRNFSSAGQRPFNTSLTAHVGDGHSEPGSLNWRGQVTLNPLQVKGDLALVRLPLHAASPYLGDRLNVSVLRADASFSGQVHVAQTAPGLALELAGDAAVDDLRVQTLAQAEPFKPAEDLLAWKSLSLSGLSVGVTPAAPARVKVAATALSDFYARMVLDASGRLNLQDLVKPVPPGTAVAQAATAVASDPPVIRFGPVSLVGGHINFTDRFIQPNYSADLTELVGRLSAFSSERINDKPELADLELRGRAQGTASLEVLGKLNPLVQPIALDIRGKVRDLELAPLSAYSAHYAGYGIERGKLSVDVNYRVTPDGQLDANNKIVLNQLKFGEQIPNAVKTLPVKLAVALLADRNGVIDVDLPISGSLNDPQFRLMPLVFKIIGNLIVKAITAPFSLLASAFGGGGDELSMVTFDAGSAVLNEAAKTRLGKVARALQDRPALKMTVVGTASLASERDAYKRAQLQALVQAEKRRASGAATTPGSTLPVVTPDEYPALLKAVYKRADFPKPRNLIGMAKDLPVPEMEALFLSNLDVTEAAMQQLALQRGVAVRDHQASQQLPMDRLFLGAAKAVTPDATWQPHAQLNLATP